MLIRKMAAKWTPLVFFAGFGSCFTHYGAFHGKRQQLGSKDDVPSRREIVCSEQVKRVRKRQVSRVVSGARRESSLKVSEQRYGVQKSWKSSFSPFWRQQSTELGVYLTVKEDGK